MENLPSDDVFGEEENELPQLALVPLPQIPHVVELRTGPGGRVLWSARCKNEDQANEQHDLAKSLLEAVATYQRTYTGDINFELRVSVEKGGAKKN